MNVIVLVIMQYLSLVAITGTMLSMLVVVTNDITPSVKRRQKLKLSSTQLRCITHTHTHDREQEQATHLASSASLSSRRFLLASLTELSADVLVV